MAAIIINAVPQQSDHERIRHGYEHRPELRLVKGHDKQNADNHESDLEPPHRSKAQAAAAHEHPPDDASAQRCHGDLVSKLERRRQNDGGALWKAACHAKREIKQRNGDKDAQRKRFALVVVDAVAFRFGNDVLPRIERVHGLLEQHER